MKSEGFVTLFGDIFGEGFGQLQHFHVILGGRNYGLWAYDVGSNHILHPLSYPIPPTFWTPILE